MSDLAAAIERLNPDASPQYLYRGPSNTADVEDDLRLLIAAARERDALAAVIEEARALARPGQSVPLGVSLWMHFDSLLAATHRKLSEAPSDALVERDACIRAEVIDWLARRIRSIPHWWDADTKYGEFDLVPLGPQRTSEQGAYMEVSRAVDDAREHFGLMKGADRGDA